MKEKQTTEEQKLERILLATTIICLEGFPNEELAALNLAMHAWKRCGPENMAYNRAFDAHLVHEDGTTWDLSLLQQALAYEVNRRVEAGIFN